MMFEVEAAPLQVKRRVLAKCIHLSVPRNEVHLLVGPNGCGKSLLLESAAGGSGVRGVVVRNNGRSIPRWSRYKAGIRLMGQAPLLPLELTVKSAVDGHRSSKHFHNTTITKILDSANISWTTQIGSLSFGQRRTVELVRLISSGAALLLDEPFAGIDRNLAQVFRKIIQNMRNDASILVVDHRSAESEELYDNIHHWPGTLLNAPAMSKDQNASVQIPFDEPTSNAPSIDIEIDSFRIGPSELLKSKTLRIAPGVTNWLQGPNGSGKSTFLRALAGVPQPVPSVLLETPRLLPASSAFLSPQPPKLVSGISTHDNLDLMLGSAKNRDERVYAAVITAEMLGFDRRRLSSPAEALSGGESSALALAGALVSEFPVLLLDEPFESLAPSAVDTALELLADAAQKGRSMIVADHSGAITRLPIDCSEILLSDQNL